MLKQKSLTIIPQKKINAFNSNAEEKIVEYDAHAESVLTETEDLFNALNTEKASGTELYIEDAKPCRIMNTEIGGMYKQETTTGTQLANFKNVSNIAIVDGTADLSSKTEGFNAQFNIEETTLTAGNYCFYFLANESGNVNTQNLKINEKTVGVFNFLTKGYNYCDFTLTEDITCSVLKLWLGAQWCNKTLKEITLIKGTHSNITKYEPYTGKIPSPSLDYPQAIEQVDSAKLQYTGSNLFDYTKTSIIPSSTSGLVITLEKNGDITVSGKPKYSYTMVVPVQDITDILKDGETYYINQSSYNKFVFLEVTATKNDGSIIYLGTTVSEKKFVVNKTNFKKYTIKVVCCNLSTWGEEEKTITSNFKLTRQKSVPFEKYQNQAINIDLKGNKLCAISDTIKDKLLIDKNGNVALQKNVEQLILIGTEKYLTNETWNREDMNIYHAYVELPKFKGSNTENLITNRLTFKRYDVYSNYYGKEIAIARRNRNILYLFIKAERLENLNLEGLKKYITEHNVTMFYELANPELIDLGQIPELPKTFEGINNIWAETNLGNTEIEIEYVQDVKKLLEKQAEQQNARLDNIEALLSTTQTSALLLDNMQTDLEKEVE